MLKPKKILVRAADKALLTVGQAILFVGLTIALTLSKFTEKKGEKEFKKEKGTPE